MPLFIAQSFKKVHRLRGVRRTVLSVRCPASVVIRFVDNDLPSLQAGSGKVSNGFVSVINRRHQDESKSSRFVGRAITGHLNREDSAVAFKQGAKLIFAGGEWQIAYKDSGHDFLFVGTRFNSSVVTDQRAISLLSLWITLRGIGAQVASDVCTAANSEDQS